MYMREASGLLSYEGSTFFDSEASIPITPGLTNPDAARAA